MSGISGRTRMARAGACLRFFMGVVFPLTLATLSVVTPAKADSAGVFVFHREDAWFAGVDTVGCMRTAVQISAIEFLFQVPPGGPTVEAWVGLLIFKIDICQNVVVLDATAHGLAPSDDFKVFGSLGSAVLRTTMSVNDAVSGTSLSVVVYMTWNGIGDVAASRTKDHTNSPECVYNSHDTTAFRFADASGTMSFQGTTLQLSAPPMTAEMRAEETVGTVARGCIEELGSRLFER